MNTEQKQTLTQRVLKVMKDYIQENPTNYRVDHVGYTMNHAAVFRMERAGVFYTVWAWSKLGSNPETSALSFEFSKGIPNTKILLSPVMVCQDEKDFIKNLPKFIDQEEDQIKVLNVAKYSGRNGYDPAGWKL